MCLPGRGPFCHRSGPLLHILPDAAPPQKAMLDAQTPAVRDALWRVVRGERVEPETLAMLRALRLDAVKAILSEGDGGRPEPQQSDLARG
jgi:hypothetical protein